MYPEDHRDQQYFENKKFINFLSEWSSFHLIIADDDEDDIELFEKAFLEIGPDFVISKANGSDELLTKLLETNPLPDLVILDLNMPAKNGFEILQEIRFHKKLSDIPVMVYSTTANTEQVHKTFELGANMYLQKPNNFQGIKSLIKTILSMNPALYIPQATKESFLFKVQ
ncbi:MAG: response regulator [Ferruginibacter sp.]